MKKFQKVLIYSHFKNDNKINYKSRLKFDVIAEHGNDRARP